ncbi:hypothetical protein BCR34DRAFT_259275 [Clohesyomyces aquaticus]|uniref:Uncharacterized protein n=1 Tax=Clohesyomyces aquaticus TaxID=1231657 RepID=A0A1Y2A9K4_9PLEO|nr:hypothetical protein BCR34DRAFT_259275 [Clohesyomyces aquaticus]
MATDDGGWAIRRNGTCRAGFEVTCGKAKPPFNACCPSGYECPKSSDTWACCPLSTNCTSELISKPKCADEKWDLYRNGGDNFFCCAPGLPGFNRSGTNGCASPGYNTNGDEVILKVIKPGTVVAVNTVRIPIRNHHDESIYKHVIPWEWIIIEYWSNCWRCCRRCRRTGTAHFPHMVHPTTEEEKRNGARTFRRTGAIQF